MVFVGFVFVVFCDANEKKNETTAFIYRGRCISYIYPAQNWLLIGTPTP